MGSRNWFALAFLLFSAWSVIATSVQRSTFNSGSFYIISDCVTPTLEATITVSSDQIATPPATSFTDFGFPQASVRIGETVSGGVRVCHPTYGDDAENADDWIFSCYDSGAYTCSILIKEQ